jgi:D-alanine transaminase
MFDTLFGIAIINGDVTTLSDAKIPLIDRGFLFGHAIFETILYQNNEFVDWIAHYDRLNNGCEKLRIPCPNNKTLFALCNRAIDETKKLIQTSQLETSFIQIQERLSLKILITGGTDPDLISPTQRDPCSTPNIYLVCRPAQKIPLEKRLQGYSAKTFLDERGRFATSIKNTNYVFAFLCLNNAIENHYDDILYLNSSDEYTEGATSSFLWFDHTLHVYSAPPIGNCLPGTSILTLKQKLLRSGYTFTYQALKQDKLSECAGCAFISSVRGVMPIKSIDNHSFDIKTCESFFKFLIELVDS